MAGLSNTLGSPWIVIGYPLNYFSGARKPGRDCCSIGHRVWGYESRKNSHASDQSVTKISSKPEKTHCASRCVHLEIKSKLQMLKQTEIKIDGPSENQQICRQPSSSIQHHGKRKRRLPTEQSIEIKKK
jgi:hypothetical protein